MSEVVLKEFEGASFRIIERDGELWWVLTDVCKANDIGNARQVASRLDHDEKDAVTLNDAIGRPQTMTIVNEGGLYNALRKSDKPFAKRFWRWVGHEVLPSIRKTGGYGAPKIDVRDQAQLTIIAAQLVEVNKELTAELSAAKPKAEWYDKYADADGLFNFRQVANALNIPQQKFIRRLEAEGYVYHDARGNLAAYAKWRPLEIFTVRQRTRTDREGNEVAYGQTLITARGLQYFASKFAPKLDLEVT